MEKEAKNQYPLHPLIKRRWSPRAFSDRPVEKEKLQSLFEAARWSPSAMNEQPWSFIVGIRDDETWKKIFDSLADGNKLWTHSSPVLMIVAGKKIFSSSQKPYTHYQYDSGQSAAYLTVEAMNQGLFVHQMAGFDAEKIISAFSIPADYHPLTAVAIGYPGDPETLHEALRKREFAERSRNDFGDFVFSGTFGKAMNIF